MVIKVNISELQSKSSYSKSIASRLREEASKLNSLYYNVDPKVRNRQSIGSSIRSLQQRLERAQQKMYNISNFLSDRLVPLISLLL